MQLRLEPLEDRTLLATIVVNDLGGRQVESSDATVAEMLKHPKWVITLRDAINIANNSPTPGGNTIVLKPQTYRLNVLDNFWYGTYGLPAITSNITSQGNEPRSSARAA